MQSVYRSLKEKKMVKPLEEESAENYWKDKLHQTQEITDMKIAGSGKEVRLSLMYIHLPCFDAEFA